MLPHWTQDDITVNGARMHYYRAGSAQSAKPSMVLAHGFSDNGLCWGPLACALENRYDIVMPDARGHGLSQRVQPGEKTDMTADLAGIISALRLARPVVGGHSMGAVVAAQLGAHYAHLVSALILEDPAWFEPKPEERQPAIISEENPFKKWVMDAQAQPLEQVVAQCRAEHPTWSEAILRAWGAGKQQLDVNFFSTEDRAWDGWQAVARAIACPTLLIAADPDKGGIITPAIADWLVVHNSWFRIAHIPGAGHHVRFEQEGAYMDAVRAFLEEIS